MRYLSAIPMLGIIILLFNALGMADQFMNAESLYFDTVLPSGAEFYLKVGDLFIIAGLGALFIEIVKAARLSSGTIVDHMLSTTVFVIALIEFLLVPFCGTATFLILMLMTLVDVVAGFSVSILTARRDFSVGSNGQGSL